MKMSMVQPGYRDGISNGANGCENYQDLLGFLDFPLENLEGEDDLVEDWDDTNFQSFGPIPSDALMGFHSVSQPYIADAAIKSEGSRNHGDKTSKASLIRRDRCSDSKKSGMLRTKRPICVFDIKSDFTIPVRTRSKRNRSPNINPWLLISASFGFKNTANATKISRNRKPMPKPIARGVQKCTHCDVTETPQWREGPLGPRTLCNACGVRYRSGRLFPEYRPAASPTFVPSIHSNSHKEVIEMRRRSMYNG